MTNENLNPREFEKALEAKVFEVVRKHQEATLGLSVEDTLSENKKFEERLMFFLQARKDFEDYSEIDPLIGYKKVYDNCLALFKISLVPAYLNEDILDILEIAGSQIFKALGLDEEAATAAVEELAASLQQEHFANTRLTPENRADQLLEEHGALLAPVAAIVATEVATEAVAEVEELEPAVEEWNEPLTDVYYEDTPTQAFNFADLANANGEFVPTDNEFEEVDEFQAETAPEFFAEPLVEEFPEEPALEAFDYGYTETPVMDEPAPELLDEPTPFFEDDSVIAAGAPYFTDGFTEFGSEGKPFDEPAPTFDLPEEPEFTMDDYEAAPEFVTEPELANEPAPFFEEFSGFESFEPLVETPSFEEIPSFEETSEEKFSFDELVSKEPEAEIAPEPEFVYEEPIVEPVFVDDSELEAPALELEEFEELDVAEEPEPEVKEEPVVELKTPVIERTSRVPSLSSFINSITNKPKEEVVEETPEEPMRKTLNEDTIRDLVENTRDFSALEAASNEHIEEEYQRPLLDPVFDEISDTTHEDVPEVVKEEENPIPKPKRTHDPRPPLKDSVAAFLTPAHVQPGGVLANETSLDDVPEFNFDSAFDTSVGDSFNFSETTPSESGAINEFKFSDFTDEEGK